MSQVFSLLLMDHKQCAPKNTRIDIHNVILQWRFGAPHIPRLSYSSELNPSSPLGIITCCYVLDLLVRQTVLFYYWWEKCNEKKTYCKSIISRWVPRSTTSSGGKNKFISLRALYIYELPLFSIISATSGCFYWGLVSYFIEISKGHIILACIALYLICENT